MTINSPPKSPLSRLLAVPPPCASSPPLLEAFRLPFWSCEMRAVRKHVQSLDSFLTLYICYFSKYIIYNTVLVTDASPCHLAARIVQSFVISAAHHAAKVTKKSTRDQSIWQLWNICQGKSWKKGLRQKSLFWGWSLFLFSLQEEPSQQQQEAASAFPNGAHPPLLPRRQSLETQYLQHRLQVLYLPSTQLNQLLLLHSRLTF